MFKQIALSFLLLICFKVNAQNNLSISGNVKDQVGAIPGATIYISGYQLSTVTDDKGNFILPKLSPGTYDILIQMLGYEPYKQNIVLEKNFHINAILKESTTMLNEVVIKPDPDRAYHLALFKDYFIGKSLNAEQCKILNTEILNTKFDKENRVFTVSANDFIIIENKALGYRIKYLLENFEYDYKSKIIFFAGNPYFEDLKGSNAKMKKWQQARETAYHGSAQHFLKSLYDKTIKEEGFVINKRIKIANPSRKPDSVINANIKKYTVYNGSNNTLNDSLNYWFKQRNMAKQINTLNSADVLLDTLVKVYNENIKTISYTDELFVIYKNEMESSMYRNSGNFVERPLSMPNYQISVIHLVEPAAYFFANGSNINVRSFLYEGYWAYEKIADMVPMDYLPQKKAIK